MCRIVQFVIFPCSSAGPSAALGLTPKAAPCINLQIPPKNRSDILALVQQVLFSQPRKEAADEGTGYVLHSLPRISTSLASPFSFLDRRLASPFLTFPILSSPLLNCGPSDGAIFLFPAAVHGLCGPLRTSLLPCLDRSSTETHSSGNQAPPVDASHFQRISFRFGQN